MNKALPFIIITLLTGAAMSAKADLAVNFGPGRAAAANATKPTTLQTGDYNFDGHADDRRLYQALDSFYINLTYTNHVSDVNNKLYAGVQVVNNNSSTDPGINLSRFSSGFVQVTTAAGTADMGLAFAPTVIKDDFLNGLNVAGNLSFSNATGSATLSLSQFAAASASSFTARLLVKSGDNWFVSGTEKATSGAGSLSVNGYTETWYAYNPSDSLFLNTGALGEGVAGSTLTDIQAFGAFVQAVNINGTLQNAGNFQVGGFTADLIPLGSMKKLSLVVLTSGQ
jgi:hypothetical protein